MISPPNLTDDGRGGAQGGVSAGLSVSMLNWREREKLDYFGKEEAKFVSVLSFKGLEIFLLKLETIVIEGSS